MKLIHFVPLPKGGERKGDEKHQRPHTSPRYEFPGILSQIAADDSTRAQVQKRRDTRRFAGYWMNPSFFSVAAGSSCSNCVIGAFSRPFSIATPKGYAV